LSKGEKTKKTTITNERALSIHRSPGKGETGGATERSREKKGGGLPPRRGFTVTKGGREGRKALFVQGGLLFRILEKKRVGRNFGKRNRFIAGGGSINFQGKGNISGTARAKGKQ